jgi:hypothetical protein
MADNVAIPTAVTTGGQTVTTPFSAPYRVTSGTATTAGSGADATDTAGAVSPGGGTASSLSGGAIAGIVVGTIAGVALLLLICACCVVRGLWHGLLAIFGIGKKKTEEDRYTRRESAHSGRDNHGSWYAGAGGGGGRPSTVASRKEKKSKGMGLLGLGAALGTQALLLGLRKDKKKKVTQNTRSEVASSYWSDSYTGGSPSEYLHVSTPTRE